MHPIVTDADLDLLLAAPLAVLYKHSPICPTSDVAYEEMLAFRRVATRVLELTATASVHRIGVCRAKPRDVEVPGPGADNGRAVARAVERMVH